MDCPSCGAGAAGNYCANCGTRLEAEDTAEVAELEAEARASDAEAFATMAEAELERATHATDEDVEVVEAAADVAEAEASADVATAAIDAVADVALAAIDAVAEAGGEEPPAEDEGDHLSELEGGAGELEQHEREHEALDDGPPQPEDEAAEAEHVEPIALLAPASTATRTTTRRSSAWRRHRR